MFASLKLRSGLTQAAQAPIFRSNLLLEALRLTGRELAGTSPRPLGFGG